LSINTGAALARLGYEVISVDMPLYGMTDSREPRIIYDDWVDISRAIIHAEKEKDDRPIILYGLSAGGMLCYQVACLEPDVKGVIGSCFLDLQDAEVNTMISGFPLPAVAERMNAMMLPVLAKTPMKRLQVPVKAVTRMSTLCNNPKAQSILIQDKSSGGAIVPLEFLASIYAYKPAIEPEKFNHCPVLLIQPGKDYWTPLHASSKFFDKLACRKQIAVLENCGHYPVEIPGLYQMRDAINSFIQSL
jgi:alpha-beta hydrolase superfamily lysophospholipase